MRRLEGAVALAEGAVAAQERKVGSPVSPSSLGNLPRAKPVRLRGGKIALVLPDDPEASILDAETVKVFEADEGGYTWTTLLPRREVVCTAAPGTETVKLFALLTEVRGRHRLVL